MDVGGLDAWAWSRICNLKVDAKKLEAWLLKSTLRSIKDGCIGYGIPGTLLEAFVGGQFRNPPPPP